MHEPRSSPVPSGHLVYDPTARPRGVLRDWAGRRYAVDRTARELTGRSRAQILRRAALALAGVGVLQFGYGAALPTLVAAHGWSPATALLPFMVWAVVQGGSAVPIARLGARGPFPAARAITVGALLCALGVLSLGAGAGLAWAILGYGLLGGAGAGLVYHSCVRLAAAWFPERPALHTCLAGGAFALGTVPVAVAAGTLLRPEHLAGACAALAAVIAGLGLAGGYRQVEPPPHWWPPETDPRAWALRGRAGPVAARDHSPAQAWRSGALPRLHAVVALAGAVALFDLAVLPVLLVERGLSPPAVAAVAATLVAASGVGRVAAGWWAERTGRLRTLVAVLTLAAVAQFGLLGAALAGSVPALLLLAVPAGVGGGSCYPLSRALVVEFFGTHDPIQGLVYSAKGTGGVLGVGGAALLLTLAPTSGYTVGLLAAGLLAGIAAVAASRLRRPIPVQTLPSPSTTLNRGASRHPAGSSPSTTLNRGASRRSASLL